MCSRGLMTILLATNCFSRHSRLVLIPHACRDCCTPQVEKVSGSLVTLLQVARKRCSTHSEVSQALALVLLGRAEERSGLWEKGRTDGSWILSVDRTNPRDLAL